MDQLRRAVYAVVAGLMLFLVVLVGIAAGDNSSAEGVNPLPDSESVSEAVQGGQGPGEEALTEPAASAGLSLDELGREEAGELLAGVFGTVVEAPSGIYDELQRAQVLGANVAVLPDADAPSGIVDAEPELEPSGDAPPAAPAELSGSGLVSSTVPLLIEGGPQAGEPIDLTLEDSGANLEPSAPLVDVRIPGELGDGIRLPDQGISVKLVDAPVSRAPSIVEGNAAFYPNVAEDSDFAVSPAPSGFETFSQLRDSDSPTIQVYRLGLPEGAELLATEDGGALVKAGEERLLAVQPPAAIDAAGDPVSVELTVDGDTLALEIAPPADAQFPILVDPLWQTYEWSTKNSSAGICSNSINPQSENQCNNREEWGYEVSAGNGSPPHLNVYPYKYGPPYTPGIGVHAGGSQIAGARGAIVYAVPRYFKENPPPTSYIKTLKVSNMRWEALGPSLSPYAYMGIWDYVNKGWISFWSHTGQVEHGVNDPAFIYNFENNAPNKNGKLAQLGIWATEATSESYANLYAGYASVELGDNDTPQQPVPTAQTQWVDKTAPPLAFTAKDTGLGVYAMNASTEGVNAAGVPLKTWTQKHGCIGVGDSACPLSWKSSEAGRPPLTYEPSVLPTGINYLALVAEDPVGNKSQSAWEEVRVDHKAPAVASLSGNLTEQGSVGTKLTKYTLNYTAKDGDDAAAVALTPIGSSAQLSRPMGVAVDQSGNTFVVDRLNNKIVKYKANGSFDFQFGTGGSGDGQFNDPRGIAIAPDGTIWVADMGNDRIQAFSPSGTFLRKGKFTDPASEPYAITTGPEGVVWVTDIGLHRLVKVSENPVSTLAITTGGGGTTLSSPTGATTDELGNVWVTDNALNKILEFNPAGNLLFQFGSPGSGPGQLSGPLGIDIAPSGNIGVVDRSNNRVQIFKPDGTFLRQFGTTGPSTNQFSEPSGFTFSSNNTALIADTANQRVARWEHADQDPQSGAAKVEVKVDGTLKSTNAPGCTTKNCVVNGSWTMNADEYTAGTHKVEVIPTDAVGISAPAKTLTVETHGDRTAPVVPISGSITEQATLGKTLPSYKIKVAATDSGPAEERKSGVAKLEIAVDGKIVDSVSPGCLNEGCSITREVTLNSSEYTAGYHIVSAIASDAAGNSKSELRFFEIKKDETAPEFANLSAFYTAPSGWVEQESYEPKVDVSDPKGYGVTSVQLKIDGQVVQSATQSCEAGSCSKQFGYGQPIDMDNYSGGAHSAELVATDGAGNSRKRAWTLNVDPDGHISASEATDTIEALEDTSDANVVGDPETEEEIEGTFPGAGTVKAGEAYKATGTAVPSTVPVDPNEGFTMSVAEGGLFGEHSCTGLPPQNEDDPIEIETCEPGEEGGFGDGPDVVPLTVTPVNVSSESGNYTAVEGNATLAQNTKSSVDTVIRPLYEGVLSFQQIRDATAPEDFSWQIDLQEGMYVKAAGQDAAEVFYENGHPAFTVTVVEAHDAVGSPVPTNLSIESNGVLTLHVHHKAQSFVYPVIAGSGWQGGYISTEIKGPMDEKETREAAEKAARELQEQLEQGAEITEEYASEYVYRATFLWLKTSLVSGPIASASSDKYPPHWVEVSFCLYPGIEIPDIEYPTPPEAPHRANTSAGRSVLGSCVNKGTRDDLLAAIAAGGYFHWINGKKVWHNANEYFDCPKIGDHQPAKVNCGVQPKESKTGITLRGDFKWPADLYHVPGPICETIYGHVNSTVPHKEVKEEIWGQLYNPGEKCDWPSWPS